jgi:hypothetical protein
VPTDYDEIRAENISRYGWDTAVLELLGQLYSDRAHFIFELIQNAEDAGATDLTFTLLADRLEIQHDGRDFTVADVRGICGVRQGTKAGDLTQIGQFGIGFKAVYAYTNSPRVHSGSENFRIESYVRPFAVDPLIEPAAATVIVLPFDRREVPAAVAVEEISAALENLGVQTLLFLRSITRIGVRGPGMADAVLTRTSAPGAGSGRLVSLSAGRPLRRGDEEWLVWERQLDALGQPGQRVEIAFLTRAGIDSRQLIRRDSSPLVVFFPTQKETFLGFVIQGPYRTTPARDNVPEHDEWNQALVRETASLLVAVLAELRDEGLLTAEVLQALPLDPSRFAPQTMFRALFESARAALAREELIPASGGGYRAAGQLMLAGGTGLAELLTPGLLSELWGADAARAFVADSVSELGTPDLWRYLRDEICLEEVTPEAVADRLTDQFLAARPDEWIVSFYWFLYQHPSLWQEPGHPREPAGRARSKPIIRLADGTQVAPFGPDGRATAYLPGSGDAEVATLDAAQHEADIELVARALDDASQASRERLLAKLQQTTFLAGENAGTGEQRLMRPGELYQRTQALETYLDGNPDAWFAADVYGPWLSQLRVMGVRAAVRIEARIPDELGYVRIADDFAWHERGVAGFDPAARIDGLEYALANPGHTRSEYIWNMLLVPHRHLISGVVEKSHRLEFEDASREEVLSPAGEAARDSAWLPAADGTFRRPADIALDDLPATFERDDVLARALEMTQPVLEAASRLLGLPAGFLRRVSRYPDLVSLLEKELRAREDRDGDDRDGEGG